MRADKIREIDTNDLKNQLQEQEEVSQIRFRAVMSLDRWQQRDPAADVGGASRPAGDDPLRHARHCRCPAGSAGLFDTKGLDRVGPRAFGYDLDFRSVFT